MVSVIFCFMICFCFDRPARLFGSSPTYILTLRPLCLYLSLSYLLSPFALPLCSGKIQTQTRDLTTVYCERNITMICHKPDRNEWGCFVHRHLFFFCFLSDIWTATRLPDGPRRWYRPGWHTSSTMPSHGVKKMPTLVASYVTPWGGFCNDISMRPYPCRTDCFTNPL